MRIFSAIEISPEIKEEIKKTQDKLKQIPLESKWVKPKNLHITLRFFGDSSARKLEKIKAIIKTVAGRHYAFEVNLGDFAFFPGPKKPRIFFLNTFSQEKLEDIAAELEKRLAEAGFTPANPFKGHITLARIKSPVNIFQLKKKISDLKINGKFKVKKISLYKSNLTNAGPIYQEIFKSNLKS